MKSILMIFLDGTIDNLDYFVRKVVKDKTETMIINPNKYNIQKSEFIHKMITNDPEPKLLENLKQTIDDDNYDFLVESDNYYYYNILHWACILGYNLIFDFLSKNTICTTILNKLSKEGVIPLHMAGLMRYFEFKYPLLNNVEDTKYCINELVFYMINPRVSISELQKNYLFMGKHLREQLNGFGSLLHIVILRDDLISLVINHPIYYGNQTFEHLLLTEDYMGRIPLILAGEKEKIPLIKYMKEEEDISQAFYFFARKIIYKFRKSISGIRF